jgi:hypothetical protein
MRSCGSEKLEKERTMIEQVELQKVVKYRDNLKELRQQVKFLEARMEDEEDGIIRRMKSGEIVEEGYLSPSISTEAKRATISWKEVVLELKGRVFIEELLSKAERQEVEKLVIAYGG